MGHRNLKMFDVSKTCLEVFHSPLQPKENVKYLYSADGWKPFQCFSVQWKTLDSSPCNLINPEVFAPKGVFKQSMLNSDLIPIFRSDKPIQKAHSIFKRIARGFIVFKNTMLYFISLHSLFTNEAHSI